MSNSLRNIRLIILLIFAFVAVTGEAESPDINKKTEIIKSLRVAEALQIEGKTQEALSAYEKLLEDHQDIEFKNEILTKIAQCYSRLGDDNSAVQAYMKLISESPDTVEASQAVSLMMNLYYQRYRFDEVVAMSEYLVRQFPGTQSAAMALYRSAGYLYTQRRYQEAIGVYENFMDEYPKSIMRATAFNRLISLYTREGMFQEAERRLAEKLEQNPGDKYMLRQLAVVYQKQGNYDRALELYQQILKSNPNDVNTYERLGELYAEKGDKEKAIAEWSKITESAQGQYSRHQMLAQILKSHGFYELAAAEYRKAIELRPEVYYLYRQLANVYVVQKQFDAAIGVYLDVLIKSPANDPNRIGITNTMLELCDLEGLHHRVTSRLESHLARSPDSVPALLALADFNFHQGRYDDSLRQLKRIAALYPDAGKGLFNHAQVLERERQFSHAIDFYQAILDLFPNSSVFPQALVRIGSMKSQLHQPQAAIASLRTLVSKINVRSPGAALWLRAYVIIGDVYLEQMHDVQAALSTYEEAKQEILAQTGNIQVVSAQLSELDLKIAECYRLMERYSEAEAVLDSMQANYKSRPVVAQIAKLRGDCYFSRGDFDSALTQYQEAAKWLMNADWGNDALDRIALIKEHSDAPKSLLEVHAQLERLKKLGQYSEALTICKSAVEKYGANVSTDRIRLEMGELLTLQMKPLEAVSAYEELTQSQSPLAPEAQSRIARIYWEQLSDLEKSIAAYSALIENYPDSVMVADARKQLRRLATESAARDNLP